MRIIRSLLKSFIPTPTARFIFKPFHIVVTLGATYNEGVVPLRSPFASRPYLNVSDCFLLKPKVNAYTLGPNGKKNNYRIKFGREIHAETAAGALINFLGFGSDITKHAFNIKIVLGSHTIENFKKVEAIQNG